MTAPIRYADLKVSSYINFSFKKFIKKLKNIPIIVEATKIFINLSIKVRLKLNIFSFFNKINKRIAFNQEDIVVAMGMIIKPISLKKIILIKIFIRTEVKEI
tara:strand:- start:3 stop:308 length:306 start_codon:yes stop_codon:yes gene_type:complete